MRQITRLALSGLLLFVLILAFSPAAPVQANHNLASTKTKTPTRTPTTTPNATNRPVIVAVYSFVKKEKILPGSDFTLKLDLFNQGNRTAYNVTATLQGDKLIPRENGGVQVFNELASGADRTMRQTMYVAPELAGQSTATLNVSVVYTDDVGSSYSTVLVILIDLTKLPPTAAYYSPAATRTPTPSPRSKLLITSYKTDLEKLQSGNMFKLTLDIQNQGSAFARNVTMVLGGATITSDGTPSSGGGGVSGGGADLSKFAPLGSSNLYSLGEIVPNTTFTQTIPLVVNVSTEPGAYPLKISFVYEDGSGNLVLDDQVITMLVYGLPQVSASFYEPVPDLIMGEFRALPIQITNIGKRASVLGDITVSASSGMLNKNTGTVGTIEAGGYFTMDAEYTADTPGPVTVTVQIKYTDDFQQPGLIEKTLTLNVIEMPTPPPDGGTNGGTGEIPVTPVEETFMDKFLKAILGFFGFSGG